MSFSSTHFDNLNNTIEKLEFLLSSSYSMMYMNADDDMVIKKSEIWGFYAIGDNIIKELKTLSKALLNNQIK